MNHLSRNTTILLAEDNTDDVFFIRRAFKKARVANPLQRVPNGKEAIDYLDGKGAYADRERFPYPCFVLLDLRMPKVDGFDVLEWIRAHPEHKDLSVVILTGEKSDPMVQKALALGVTSYFNKTPNFDDMVKLVEGLRQYWLITNVAPEALVAV